MHILYNYNADNRIEDDCEYEMTFSNPYSYTEMIGFAEVRDATSNFMATVMRLFKNLKYIMKRHVMIYVYFDIRDL